MRKLARPVTLAEIKSDAAFKDFALVRISRLSVMPVTDEQWERIEKGDCSCRFNKARIEAMSAEAQSE